MEYMDQGDFPISKYLTAKAAARKIPLSGVFELTSRCNFNCKMCYIHGKEGLLFLLLTGGEAMLRDDFAGLYEALAKMGFRLVINTNGSMVTDEILELFRKYPPVRVNVSMYGASDDTYARLCGNRKREHVAKAIRDMKAIGLSVRTTMTVTPYNCEDMQQVYDFIDDNPMVAMMDVGYTNDPYMIARNPKTTAINSALQVDLTGQVCADSLGTKFYSGTGGQVDFVYGASLSEGGKAIIAMPSCTKKGESKIAPTLLQGAGVVTSRAHIHWFVTEYGAVDLYGKSLQERAKLVISVAHPDHREMLDKAAFERFGPHYHHFGITAG